MIWLSFLYMMQLSIGQGHMVSGNQLIITNEIISNSLRDTVAPHHQQHSQDDLTDIVAELHRSLRFDPPKLDFGAWSIGTAKSQTVTLVNKNSNRSVYLSSVSGKTPAFYSSFFENKVVPPQGNTTFNVVFLPRTYGAVTTNLLIHTSFGQAKFLVKGEGMECPYRLKPIVGIRAPYNSTLAPEIHMYNPHERSLQILEVYSSGGQFQLELPSGGQEGPQALWEIPPHSTKPVIRIRFNGVNSGNHTAYIRIKISELNEENVTSENVLVIPVEFEILAKHGLYSENPILDFGRLTTFDATKSIKIELKNSGKKSIQVIDYSLRNCETTGLFVNAKDSTVSIDPAQINEDSLINGQLVITSMSQQNSSEVFEYVMYIRAEVFKGTLKFEKNATTFITKSKSFVDVSRIFYIKNDFAISTAVLNVTFERNDSSIFQISNMRLGVLQPGELIPLFQIYILDKSANFETSFQIITNITRYGVPLIVCTGLLEWQTLDAEDGIPLPQNTILDLGTIPFGELSHSGYIVLRNMNPIPIELSSWDFTSPEGVYFHSTFLGCLKPEKEKHGKTQSFSDTKFELCFNLLQNYLAVYKIAIQSFLAKPLTGAFKIWTNHEQITTAVKFSTIMGKLEVDQELLYFKNCFPGKLCSSELSIRSTFLKPMRINAINFTDPGLRFVDYVDQGTWIAPNTLTKVGRIYFEPAKLCQNRCYIPVDDNVNHTAPSTRLEAFSSNSHLNVDETELRRRTEIFRHLKWYLQTVTFTLNSSEIRQFKLNLTVDIEWPKLVNGKQMISVIEVGQTHKANIVVSNPADSPILVDFFMSDPKFSKNTRLSLPLEVVDICTHCYLTDKDVFFLPNVRVPVIVPPQGNLSISVEFSSNDVGIFSTILHIRNNLTLYEAVWLTAKTVQSQFKFGNRKPGSQTPLLFEVGEKHLMPCLNTKYPSEHVQVTTRRTFTARNTGEIPILVESFFIGGLACEGFGFKILDCNGFELKANTSRKIDIAFSPDFTLARVSRPLVLKTNLSYYVNYILLATMPPSCLDQCSVLLPRPYWEQRIKSISLIMLVTLVIFVSIAAHFDAGKVLTDHLRFMSREKGPLQPTLNLRNIAVKSTITQSDTTNLVQNCPNNRSSRASNKNCNISALKKRTTKKSIGSGTFIPNTSYSTCQDVSWAQELAKTCSQPKDIMHLSKITASAERSSKNKDEPKFTFVQTQKYLETEKCNGSTLVSDSNEKDKQTQMNQKVNERSKTDAPQSVQNYNHTESARKQKNSFKKTKNVIQCEKVSRETSGDSVKERPDERSQKSVATRSPKQTYKTNEPSKKQETPKTNDIVGSPVPDSSSKPLNSIGLNGNGKKCGKTPGRERKKEQTLVNSKRFERKQKSKGNCLNFSTSLQSTTNNVLPSAWDTNQVSFSNVVAQKCPLNNVEEASFDTKDFYNDFCEWKDSGASSGITGCSTNNFESKTLNKLNQSKIENVHLVELGPIGSKKSPSSTPIWEPLPSTNLQIPKPTLCNNSSFFSNLMPSYVYNENNQYMGNIPSEVYDLQSAEEQLQRHWKTSEYMFSLQQQRQHQRQSQVSQNIEESHYQKDANWPIGAQTWTPMGYGQSDPAKSTSLNPWQRPNLRPPPGLEFPKRDDSQSSPKTFAAAGAHQNSSEHNDQLMSSAPIDTIEIDPIQPFDPFSSLSSIWSDNWNKNKNGTI